MTEVDAVLAEYPSDCRPTDITPLGSAGGMSGALFWRIAAPGGIFVLRRWPPEHPSPKRLEFIHAVLRHAVKRGCSFLPVPATAQAGQSFIPHAGYLWELAPWMPGLADYEHSPSSKKLRAALIALAQFHVVVADFPQPPAAGSTGGSNATIRHLTRLRELTSAEIRHLSNAITDTTWADLAPLARQFVASLSRAIPPAIAQLEPLAKINFPLQPCLRDIWHDHVLFTGDEVTGLVDFGAIDIDTPATDIARLLGSFASVTPLPFREWLGEGLNVFDQTWREGLAAYNTVRQLSPDEIRAAYALNASGTILAGCNWIRWIYIDGNQFDNHARIIERFRRIAAAT